MYNSKSIKNDIFRTIILNPMLVRYSSADFQSSNNLQKDFSVVNPLFVPSVILNMTFVFLNGPLFV